MAAARNHSAPLAPGAALPNKNLRIESGGPEIYSL
jgi:hypothetical protein